MAFVGPMSPKHQSLLNAIGVSYQMPDDGQVSLEFAALKS